MKSVATLCTGIRCRPGLVEGMWGLWPDQCVSATSHRETSAEWSRAGQCSVL